MSWLEANAYWLLPVVLVTLATAAVAGWWYRRRDTLDRLLGKIAWARLVDVVVPDDVDGEIHLDLALLTPKGILVLEVRRGAGTLFWGEQLDYWTLLDGRRRDRIRNPLPGLRARRHAVHALAPRVPVSGRVLLLGPVEISGAGPPGVMTPEALAAEFARPPGAKVPPELGEAWAAVSAQARPLA
ncbi:nuclease-related domain-containing protein [Thioalkalivibrio sp. XN8]|uniref:nuclease-related domain-containing protein n=1 Tax=Thioalkalivibrio sp. XN8 TaxID=2712863 RepID=UPI0013EA6174|nr:nuclease-related domain-containing protein [Thioalkalivibrio sp. XN8]NGP54750.1 NERD domain-containing protein [Thioalkalivibrio sp. XN8]